MSVLAELRSAMRQVDRGKSVKKEQRRKLDAQFKAKRQKNWKNFQVRNCQMISWQLWMRQLYQNPK
ncbi:hypothetical protein DPMN_190708 [Dreissena polymorpha]|uniref:Uncharacterized protein n=1 Tax=Dreissena polymorpha TaxID=45954 RepID=A0A9D4BD69_DREPO|nr:hypothetical protein DPMN_190708 [Dreissena polymorpha]